jgi:hypothetical protein
MLIRISSQSHPDSSDLIILLNALHALMCGHYRLDTSVGVELHLVYAGLAVPAGSLAPVDKVLVDTMVYDVPLVFTGDLQHAVMSRAIDLLLGALDEDDGLIGYLDGAEG